MTPMPLDKITEVIGFILGWFPERFLSQVRNIYKGTSKSVWKMKFKDKDNLLQKNK